MKAALTSRLILLAQLIYNSETAHYQLVASRLTASHLVDFELPQLRRHDLERPVVHELVLVRPRAVHVEAIHVDDVEIECHQPDQLPAHVQERAEAVPLDGVIKLRAKRACVRTEKLRKGETPRSEPCY